MASPDLRKARSIADGKIMLVPTHVDLATPTDSYSGSSSDSDDGDSSDSESSSKSSISPHQKLKTFDARRPASAKIPLAIADNQVSSPNSKFDVIPTSKIKADTRLAKQHNQSPHVFSKGQTTDAEVNWTRLQFAQTQLANHLAIKQNRIGSAKRSAEAEARRRAENRVANSAQSNPPSVMKPVTLFKTKRLNGDNSTHSSRISSADSSAARRNDDEVVSVKSGADSGLWSEASRFRAQRAAGASNTSYSLVKRIAVRTEDRSDRLSQLEKQIREQLGTIASQMTIAQKSNQSSRFPSASSQVTSGNGSGSGNGNGNGRSIISSNAAAAAASLSNFRPPSQSSVTSSVPEVVKSSSSMAAEAADQSSDSQTASIPASAATQLARPTVRRPCLASLPTPFASARSLLHANGLLSTATIAPMTGYSATLSSSQSAVTPAPPAAAAAEPAAATSEGDSAGGTAENGGSSKPNAIPNPPKVVYRTALGSLPPGSSSNGGALVDDELNAEAAAEQKQNTSANDRRTLESVQQFKQQLPSPLSGSVASTTQQTGNVALSLVNGWQASRSLPLPFGGIVRERPLSPSSVATTNAVAGTAVSAVVNEAISSLRQNIRFQLGSPMLKRTDSTLAASLQGSSTPTGASESVHVRLNVNGSAIGASPSPSPSPSARISKATAVGVGKLNLAEDLRAPLAVAGENIVVSSRYSRAAKPPLPLPPPPPLPGVGVTSTVVPGVAKVSAHLNLNADSQLSQVQQLQLHSQFKSRPNSAKPTLTNGLQPSSTSTIPAPAPAPVPVPKAQSQAQQSSVESATRKPKVASATSVGGSVSSGRPGTTDLISVGENETEDDDESKMRADSDDDELSDVGRDQDDADGNASNWDGDDDGDDRRSTRSVASVRSADLSARDRIKTKLRAAQSAILPQPDAATTMTMADADKKDSGATSKKRRTRRRSVGDDPDDLADEASSKLTSQSAITRPVSGEQSGLIPSRFVYMPVVLRFVPEGEQVEKLSWEIRKVLKWRMSSITPVVVKKCILRSGFRITKKAHDWLGCFGRHMRTEGFKAIRRYQKFNHFPGSFQIGRKDRLWRNVHRMQNLHGKSKGDFDFVPDTFVLPDDYEAAKMKWEEQENSSHKPIFIMKPPAAARGRGVKVVRKWSDVPKKRPLVVQTYVRNPFLINGYKFDLRIYVYVSSIDPLRIYVHRDGLVRFASARFSLQDKSLKNRYAHLTNYSVNCQNKEYRPNKDSNNNSEDTASAEQQSHKWSLKAFWSYLNRQNIRCDSLWPDIKDIVVKTIMSAEATMNSAVKANLKRRYCVHELFGFDILVDTNMRPWLLECNISPSLHSDSPLDVRVKSHMIADMFNVAGFQIPDSRAIKPLRSKYASRYQVDGGDVDDYQAMLVSAPYMTSDTTTTSAGTARVSSAKSNGKDKDGDQADCASKSTSSSSESEDEDEEDPDRPFFVTDKRISTRKLSLNERNKHIFYCQNYQNEKMMDTILNRLTPDDVYVLCEMIDEFTRVGEFDIAFPTSDSMNSYFRYFEQPRYYNLLAAYFLKKFNTPAKMEQAVSQLNAMCKKKIHLATNLSANSEHYWVSPAPVTRLGY